MSLASAISATGVILIWMLASRHKELIAALDPASRWQRLLRHNPINRLPSKLQLPTLWLLWAWTSLPFGQLYGWEIGICVWLCVAMMIAMCAAMLAPIRPHWVLASLPLFLAVAAWGMIG